MNNAQPDTKFQAHGEKWQLAWLLAVHVCGRERTISQVIVGRSRGLMYLLTGFPGTSTPDGVFRVWGKTPPFVQGRESSSPFRIC